MERQKKLSKAAQLVREKAEFEPGHLTPVSLGQLAEARVKDLGLQTAPVNK